MTATAGRLTPQIIELHGQGLSVKAIAHAVGCSAPNVVRCLQRHTRWDCVVAGLPKELEDWLLAEARRSRASPAIVARAMLVDAINEAMEEGT